MDITAKELSFDWDIVDRKNVLINFSYEKLRSALATVTGKVRKVRKAA